jgi:hypothetical protein
MHVAAGFASILAKPLQIEAIILFGKKTGLPVVTAPDDVEWNIG